MKPMNSGELYRNFIGFFEKKNHREIPSSPLIPQDDSSTLFISAGMHPLVPYLLGEPHPSGKRLVDVQECLRTGDIESVGDSYHHTWFEMLGNWSLGDYFKKEMIPWSFEFLTQNLGLDPAHLHVTCFAGDADAPRDKESALIWESLGINPEKIHFLPKKDNWWGPAGKTGPCGPDSEMFVDLEPQSPAVDFVTGGEQGRYREIWNDVFMEFNKSKDGTYASLSQKNVDTGMGVERAVAIMGGFSDHYLTPIWQPIIAAIEKISGQKYAAQERPMRIIADHVRAAVFVIADGILPANKEAGYVLRRLIRRSIRQGKILGIEKEFLRDIAEAVMSNQNNFAGKYPELDKNRGQILATLAEEETRFRHTLDKGLKELAVLFAKTKEKKEKVFAGEVAFSVYETFGFPLEMICEEADKEGLTVDKDGFLAEQEKHQNLSRTASEGRFKGGLAAASEKIIRGHTATHLLQAALRQILGEHVSQAGSNITEERLRFDFTHASALTKEEIKKVEDLVNQKISENLAVTMTTMTFPESQKVGALAFFKDHYPDQVKVYSIDNFSREVCGGPHVESTGKVGHLRIIKEENCGAGKRRIYAALDD